METEINPPQWQDFLDHLTLIAVQLRRMGETLRDVDGHLESIWREMD